MPRKTSPLGSSGTYRTPEGRGAKRSDHPVILQFPTARARNAGANPPSKPKRAKAASKPEYSRPHYHDLSILKEILELPDSPRSYDTKAERKVLETRAMAAQRRIMQNFASRTVEYENRCKKLEAENRKLREQIRSSKAPSRKRGD